MAIRFGVIFISDSTIDSTIDRRKAKQLRSILERKKECNFIEFDMDLVKLLPGIFYCENANTHKYH
ncbi:hypothetical protein [Helicobacter pylori]|uniref:hypothetical protein n=1 Tax=Helicobacter pylori TaxID=210 RepID=UPI000C303A2E|nr:hypothetical protein [Helicobacter pylori]